MALWYAITINMHLHMYSPFATLAILENVPQGKKKVLKPAALIKYNGTLIWTCNAKRLPRKWITKSNTISIHRLKPMGMF